MVRSTIFEWVKPETLKDRINLKHSIDKSRSDKPQKTETASLIFPARLGFNTGSQHLRM